MNAAGIIFSNLHDNKITELTRQRTMASIPFACRYRLIDFALSNMVNAEITNINVIAHYNYHSLMDHIGTGKDWDLARRTGGIKILPPYITAYANTSNNLYNTRLEALCSVIHSIRHIKEDYVVLSDCDVICNIDVKKLLEYHVDYGAPIPNKGYRGYFHVHKRSSQQAADTAPKGSLVKGSWHAEGVTEGFYRRHLLFLKIQCGKVFREK